MANVVRNLSTVGLSDTETTVVKATYDDDDKPKAKHVDALLRMSLRSPNMDLMGLFRARLAEKSWNVVLKTLVVIHRLMNEGSEGFLRIVSEKPLELNTLSFHDRRSSLAWAMTRLIHVYGDYLCEKATVFKSLQFCGERMPTKESSKFFMELSLQKLVLVMPPIQMQLDKLLCCTPYTEDDQPHPIAHQAATLFIRDAFRLYSLTTVMILLLIDKFLKMNKKEATIALECTKVYVAHSEKFKKWTDTLVRLKIVDPTVLPKFDNVPAGFTDLLANHIKHCDDEAATSLADLVGEEGSTDAKRPAKKPAAAAKEGKSAPAKGKAAAAPAMKPKPKAAAPPPEPEDEPGTPEGDAPTDGGDGDGDAPAAAAGDIEDPFADPTPAAAKPKPKTAPKPAAAAKPKPAAAAKPKAAGAAAGAGAGASASTGPKQVDLFDLTSFMSSPAAAPTPAAAPAPRKQPVAAAAPAAAVEDPFNPGAGAGAGAAVEDPFGDMSGYANNALAAAAPAPKPAAAQVQDPFNLFNS